MPFGNFDDSVSTITALSSRSSARWREDCGSRIPRASQIRIGVNLRDISRDIINDGRDICGDAGMLRRALKIRRLPQCSSAGLSFAERLAADPSPEGDEFEPSVPRKKILSVKTVLSRFSAASLPSGTEGSDRSPSLLGLSQQGIPQL
jgi:hypothetical protein